MELRQRLCKSDVGVLRQRGEDGCYRAIIGDLVDHAMNGQHPNRPIPHLLQGIPGSDALGPLMSALCKQVTIAHVPSSSTARRPRWLLGLICERDDDSRMSGLGSVAGGESQ